jgi:Fe-S cluster assembly iron-binding protein IscA
MKLKKTKGDVMFEVTQKALDEIKKYLKEKKQDAAVRITMSIG